MPESLISFPCAFPIKVMGIADAALAPAIVEVVLRHAPDFEAATIETRASAGGKYVGLTCTVQATSQAQLDALYRELTSHPLVKVVL